MDADEIAWGLSPRAAEILGRLRCVECGRLSGFDARGWRAVRGQEGLARPRLFVVCPDCADFEID
jgi:hypothetical protein